MSTRPPGNSTKHALFDRRPSHPRFAALLDAPRVILRVLCWNEDASPPTPSLGAFKLRVTHLLPTTVLPYGAEPLPRLAPQPTQPPPSLSATPRRRPRSAAAAALPPVERMAPGRALRTYGGVLRGAMLQAATTRLEDEVAQMQAALESAQQLANSARGGSGEQARPQSAWMSRALKGIAIG